MHILLMLQILAMTVAKMAGKSCRTPALIAMAFLQSLGCLPPLEEEGPVATSQSISQILEGVGPNVILPTLRRFQSEMIELTELIEAGEQVQNFTHQGIDIHGLCFCFGRSCVV